VSEAGAKAVIVVHRAVRVLLLGFVPVIAVVIGLYVYATGGQQVETDNAYVKANIVPISSGVTGRVIEVLASDNQPVEAGAVLFRLDPVPYQIAVDGARAQMEVVHAAVQSLRAE
jgi:membrane fusion protein (multidrug efflux system)